MPATGIILGVPASDPAHRKEKQKRKKKKERTRKKRRERNRKEDKRRGRKEKKIQQKKIRISNWEENEEINTGEKKWKR